MTAPTAPGSTSDAEFLEITLDSIDALVLVVGADGGIVRFNEACERVTGYTEGEVLGRRPSDFLVPPEYVDRARTTYSRVVRGAGPYRHENPWIARDGGRRIIAWTLAPALNPDGEVRCVVCTGRDVTEQRAWEGATRESEERFRSVFEQAAVGMAILSPAGELTRVNRRLVEITGFGAKGLVGTRAQDVLHPDDRDLYDQSLEQLRTQAHGDSVLHDLRIVRADGSIAWVRVSTAVAMLTADSVSHYIAVLEDVTSHHAAIESLRRSEEVFRLTAQAASDIIWRWDLGDSIDWVGDVDEALGYPRGQFPWTVKGWLSAIHPEDRERVSAAIYSHAHGGPPYNEVYRIARADSSWRVWLDRGLLLRGADGLPSVMAGACTDITESHEAAARLRASEQRLELAMVGADLGIFDWYVDSGAITCNARFEAILGMAPGELPSQIQPLMDRVHPEDSARTRQSMVDHFHGRTARYESEHRMLTRDGQWRWVLSRGRVMERDPGGRALRVAGTFLDIEERKQDEQRLVRQAELIDNARDIIVVMDLDGRVLLWNPSAERVHGRAAAEVLGCLASDFVCQDPGVFAAARTATLATGAWQGELVQLTRDGQDVIVDAHWTLLRDKHGNPDKILAIGMDVTEQRKLEIQFLRAQRLESIGTLAGGMAHDLNNVLAPILMSVDLLRAGTDDIEREELLGVVESSARRGAWLVRQVLSFARGMDGQRIAVNAAELLRDVQKLLADTFPKDIAVFVELAEPLPTVVGDPTQLHQVLLNLCLNARDAMPDGGRLDIRACAGSPPGSAAEHEGGFLQISVADTGSGISAALHDKVFDPFFTTKEVGKGTGLGLSTVAAIVRGHGGATTLVSQPGAGAIFTVFLPVASGGTGDSDLPEEVDRRAPAGGNGELILVVDDEASVAAVITQALEAAGYETISASNGAEAVALFAANPVAVSAVITDMIMPVMDGPATLLALRRLRPDVRVIAVSGVTSDEAAPDAVPGGFSAFLAKPFRLENLLRVVGDTLAAPQA